MTVRNSVARASVGEEVTAEGHGSGAEGYD